MKHILHLANDQEGLPSQLAAAQLILVRAGSLPGTLERLQATVSGRFVPTPEPSSVVANWTSAAQLTRSAFVLLSDTHRRVDAVDGKTPSHAHNISARVSGITQMELAPTTQIRRGHGQ